MIHYIRGDATEPIKTDCQRYLIHICNDVGAWGAGFVLALSNKWKSPEETYRLNKPRLGDVQFVKVEDDLIVCNMVAQRGIGGGVRVDYEILCDCLCKVRDEAEKCNDYSIHFPQIGAGLGGGYWPLISTILEGVFVHPMYCYIKERGRNARISQS